MRTWFNAVIMYTMFCSEGFTQDKTFDQRMRSDLTKGALGACVRCVCVCVRARMYVRIFCVCGCVRYSILKISLTLSTRAGGRVATFHHSNSTIKMSKTSTFTGGSGGFRHFSPCYKFIQKVEKLPARDLDASNAELRRASKNSICY